MNKLIKIENLYCFQRILYEYPTQMIAAFQISRRFSARSEIN